MRRVCTAAQGRSFQQELQKRTESLGMSQEGREEGSPAAVVGPQKQRRCMTQMQTRYQSVLTSLSQT